MTNPAWAHLPNAKHIDRVLAHLHAHPDKWSAAWGAARDAAWSAAWGAARAAAWDAARGAARAAAWDAARGAAYALIAWDDAGDVLAMPVDAVRLLAACGHPPAVLLLPACIAFESTITIE
jgi:hypothetical protein